MIRNVCHGFVSLDRNEAWQVISFSIYQKWIILSNVLTKIKPFSQILSKAVEKLELKKADHF